MESTKKGVWLLDGNDMDKVEQVFEQVYSTSLKDIVFIFHSTGKNPDTWEKAAKMTCELLYGYIKSKPPIEGNPRVILKDSPFWKGDKSV